jgi:sulfur carrier protein
MIEIEVRYFATLRKDGIKRENLTVRSGITTEELVDDLRISMDDIAILLVNGVRSESDKVLKEGDVVSLFPPVGGG